jgi:hypothetical protein
MSGPAFTRTPPGLSNQAAFLGVDLVVFSEGGAISLTFSEVEQGLGDETTVDAQFWKLIIEKFAPNDKRVHVKSVGSKTTVLAIAELVAAGSVSKVVAAMDRDLDQFRGCLVSHCNVIYTSGYSWENDVWTIDTCNRVLGFVVPNKAQREMARQQADEFFANLQRQFMTAVRFDRALAASNRALLHRDTLVDLVRPAPPQAPKIARGDLAALLRASRSANVGIKPHSDRHGVLDDLHGHTLAKAVMHVLRAMIQQVANHKLSNALLTSIAITQFVNSDADPKLAVYQTPLSQIVW